MGGLDPILGMGARSHFDLLHLYFWTRPPCFSARTHTGTVVGSLSFWLWDSDCAMCNNNSNSLLIAVMTAGLT